MIDNAIKLIDYILSVNQDKQNETIETLNFIKNLLLREKRKQKVKVDI